MPGKATPVVASTPLSRVVWKEGRVLAFETRSRVYVLGQMLESSDVAFFDAFAKDAQFSVEMWDSASVLYVSSVTDQFLRATNVRKTELEPKPDIPVPDAWINPQIDPVYKPVVLWEGTKYERRLRVEYSGALMCISGQGDDWPCDHDFLIRRIRINDRKTIENHELQSAAVHPYSNHRLHLCYKLGRNADPYKELVFRRPLPLEYRHVIKQLYPRDHF